jgi:putative PIN family toxin of toxin-antitoxin system
VRIVLDTNVIVSALIWRGPPYELLQMAIDGVADLCTSLPLLDELHEVLMRDHLSTRLGQRHVSVEDAVTLYGDLAFIVSPILTPRVVPGDADDDHVIAAAIAARADLLVSGDRHLLILGSHRSIRIVTPAEAVRLIADI